LLVYLVFALLRPENSDDIERLVADCGLLRAAVACGKALGLYMARVYERQKTWLDPCWPVERLLYRLTGVNPEAEMRWTEYGAAMLIFSCATLLLTYAIERCSTRSDSDAEPASI